MEEKKSWKRKPNNLLSVFYINDLTANFDSDGYHVDKHDDPLAAISNPLNKY